MGSRFRGNDNGAGMTVTPAKAGVQCWRLSHLFLTGAPAIFMAAKNLSILRIKHFRDSSSPSAPQNDTFHQPADDRSLMFRTGSCSRLTKRPASVLWSKPDVPHEVMPQADQTPCVCFMPEA